MGSLARIGMVFVAFGLTSWTAPTAPEEVKKPEFAIDLSLARRCFEEAKALSEVDGGRFWGKPLYGPMLFVDPVTRQIVANQLDHAKTLREQDGVWVGMLPPGQQPANTAFTWGGVRWTMVLWPLPQDRYTRGSLLMHELFHRIQDDLGLPSADTDNSHLSTREGRTWLRLEWRALAEALIHDGEKRRQAAADALVFRAYRRTLFAKAAEAERAMELHEGLAEYTGFSLSGLPSSVLADRVAMQLARQEEQPSFVRSFAYASGPAYGVLLDECGQKWRPGASSKPDLGDLLAQALKITLPDDLAREAHRRAERYDDGRVIAVEKQREETRQRVQAQFRRRFQEGPVLELPAGKDVNYSFNPNQVEVLEGAGNVYLTASVKDEWGTLTVTSGGLLMVRDKPGRLVGWRLSAPTDPSKQPLSGDGWTLELARGWSVQPGTRRGDWRLERGR